MSANKLVYDFKDILEYTDGLTDTTAYLVATSLFRNYFEGVRKGGFKEIDVDFLIEICNEMYSIALNRSEVVREQAKEACGRFEDELERVTANYQELHRVVFKS